MLHGAAWSLIPIAAYLTGSTLMLWRIGVAIGAWASAFVFSTQRWAGVAVAGLIVVLFLLGGGRLRRRQARAKRQESRERKLQASQAAEGGAGASGAIGAGRTLPAALGADGRQPWEQGPQEQPSRPGGQGPAVVQGRPPAAGARREERQRRATWPG